MGVNTIAGRGLLSPGTMKRICSLCFIEKNYVYVKKYTHGLQLCNKCQEVIAELSLPVESIFKHR